MTLRQILKAKIDAFNSVDTFLEGVASTQRSIYSKMLTLLRSFADGNGNLSSDSTNRQTLLGINRTVIQEIAQSTLQRKLDKFLVNFDKVGELNEMAYEAILQGNFRKVDISTEKQLFVDQVVNSLSRQSSLNAQFTLPIRQIIYTAVTRGTRNLKEIEQELRNFIVGTDNSHGRLRAYAGQVTTDAINGFDGAVNDLIRDANGLTHFRYVGSLIRTSRENCIDLINGTGRFAEFSLGRGIYRVEDIQRIIQRADKSGGSGFNPLVSPSNFAQIRMGYNCRHQVIYFNYNEPDQQRILGRFQNQIE